MYVCNCHGITEAQVKAGVKVEPHPRCGRCIKEIRAIQNPEQWRPVVGFPGYAVSSEGRVYSLPRPIQYSDGRRPRMTRGQYLKPGIASNGYPSVVLGRKNGRGNTRMVHTLVALAFLGPRPYEHDVRHKDDNRTNPRLDNLHYGSRLDNVEDCRRSGRWNPWGWKRASA